MFYEAYTPKIITYPAPAAGWKNGIYRERAAQTAALNWADACGTAYVTVTEDALALSTRMWTETEETGFGIFPYAEGLAFCKRTGLSDGQWSFTFSNPTDIPYPVSVYANGILKLDHLTAAPQQDTTAEFTLCSAEEITTIQIFVPTTCTEREQTENQVLFLKSLRYAQLPAKEPHTVPTVFLASDSTVQTYEEFYYPQTGWGQVFSRFFVPDSEWSDGLPEDAAYPQCHVYRAPEITIENRSIGARSSRSFIAEGKWDALLHRAALGDFCLIQWAHNDATAVRPNRYVAPEDFAFYLKKYIASCKSRGIHPVLVTPVSRRNCDDHNGDFALSFDAYRRVMLELGEKERIPVIDLCLKSNEYLNEIGAEESKLLYLWCTRAAFPESAYADGVSDNTHLQEYGALLYARMVAQEIADSPYPEFAPLKPLIHTDLAIEKPKPPIKAPASDERIPHGFAIQELHIEQKTANFLLIWDDVPGAVSYNVYRKGTADFQFFLLRSVTQEEKTSSAVLPFKLPAADVYQLYVTAVFKDKQESAPSRRLELRA